MYGEVIQLIMQSKIISMAICFSLAIVVPVIYLVIFDVPFKKKKISKKKKNQKKKETKEALTGAISLLVCFLLLGCIALGEYLALRQDFVTENYATYTGEFYYHFSPKGPDYVEWTDDQGKTQRARYLYRIEKFQDSEQRLREDYYKGTIVYAPNGGHLLWWDAERIGD